MKRGNRTRYTKKPGSTFRSPSGKPLNVESNHWKLYQDCRVPLDVFLDCSYDGDFDGLVIKGDPPENIIREAWEAIYKEFCELVGGGNELFEKTVEINTIVAKVGLVDMILKHFRVSVNDELIAILKREGVDCGIKMDDDPLTRYKKMEQVVGRAKLWMLNLEVLRKEFDELQIEHSKLQGGREAYETNLMNLSHYRKYSIQPKDLTVRQYLKSLKQMEEEYQRLASKYNQ